MDLVVVNLVHVAEHEDKGDFFQKYHFPEISSSVCSWALGIDEFLSSPCYWAGHVVSVDIVTLKIVLIFTYVDISGPEWVLAILAIPVEDLAIHIYSCSIY